MMINRLAVNMNGRLNNTSNTSVISRTISSYKITHPTEDNGCHLFARVCFDRL